MDCLPRGPSIVLTLGLALVGCSSDPIPNRSEPKASYAPVLANSSQQAQFPWEKSGYLDFFQRLNYDQPIFGIRVPLVAAAREPGSGDRGSLVIGKAFLEPSGLGIWKTALSPKLVLEKVEIEGTGQQIGSALRQLQANWPGGVEIRGLEISWKAAEANHLRAEKVRFEEKQIYLEKGLLSYKGKQTPVGQLDLKIFQP